MLDRIPQVFISYSWTIKDFVIGLATRLRQDGIDVKLDVWDLKEGYDKFVFMEQCVSNPNIDKVLIVSDRAYQEKADQRKGGVGNETTVISKEVYHSAVQDKFIPVLAERDKNGDEYLPIYLRTRIYIDLSGDKYEEEYKKLVRRIYEEPEERKPELGTPPAWLTESIPTVLLELRKAKKDSFVDLYISALVPFYKETPTNEEYLTDFKAMKEYRNAFLDALIRFSEEQDFGIFMADTFEQLYNGLFNIKRFRPGAGSYYMDSFDIFLVHIWELFICTVAYMLHYGRFADIRELLVHTYFLNTAAVGSGFEARSYESFCFYSKIIENSIKPSLSEDMSRKLTLAGHYLCKEREYLPVYSGKSIAEADLFLYQVNNGLDLEGLKTTQLWFPRCYVYADRDNSMWKKLPSRKWCTKIMPLFNVTSLDALKDKLACCDIDREYHFSNSWHSAPSILSITPFEQIAILP